MSILIAVGPHPGRARFRRIFFWLFMLGLLVVLGVVALNLWMCFTQRSHIFANVNDVPMEPVALVLGASPGFFDERLNAAVELYHAGKVSKIIVSGDGSLPPGDETDQMRLGLVARGIPVSAILSDYAGWRTLDSVARAKKVFGLEDVIIVSQAYHLPRALFLAQHWGLNAVGYPAADPGGAFLRTKGREWLARVLAFADIELLNRQPRSLNQERPAAPSTPPTATAPAQ